MILEIGHAERIGRFQTAAHFAYHSLRKMIITGELGGGVRLNQDELAARFELSRMPIRQAIQRLESEGLVTIRPSRGAIVTSLGSASILELFEIRSVLEGLAFRLAIPKIGTGQIVKLERQIRALEVAQPDVGRWLRLHEQFHQSLCEYSGRPRLTEQIRFARQAVTPYVRLYLATHEGAEIEGFEHRGLLDAIVAGDPAEGERTMREHIMSVAREVAELRSRSSNRSENTDNRNGKKFVPVTKGKRQDSRAHTNRNT
jgi:DNA-binding GntR family transcriptional regulator